MSNINQESGTLLAPPPPLPPSLSRYLVCTEEGLIHKCSCSYNEQVLETYKGHTVCSGLSERHIIMMRGLHVGSSVPSEVVTICE